MPVVLAFPVQEAGRKVVDYYMTWRGKTVACIPSLSSLISDAV